MSFVCERCDEVYRQHSQKLVVKPGRDPVLVTSVDGDDASGGPCPRRVVVDRHPGRMVYDAAGELIRRNVGQIKREENWCDLCVVVHGDELQ